MYYRGNRMLWISYMKIETTTKEECGNEEKNQVELKAAF